jgi:hypothetical protein
MSVPKLTFFIAKYFGSGVIIATAFIHVMFPAEANHIAPLRLQLRVLTSHSSFHQRPRRCNRHVWMALSQSTLGLKGLP